MIHIKTSQDIVDMRLGGRILASVLKEVKAFVREGVTTLELDSLAEKLIREAGCVPAFKGYQSEKSDPPFPGTLCTSINNEVVHAIPSKKRVLKDGDIIGLDIGLSYQGKERSYILDLAETVAVGDVSDDVKKLLSATQQALFAGIEQMQPGNSLEDVSKAISKVLTDAKLGIVRDLCGHGVGYELHEDPYVLNYIPKAGYPQEIILKPGMVLALEPMATLGDYRVDVAKDGWTCVTHDQSWSAQFEHSVAITQTGHIILTEL